MNERRKFQFHQNRECEYFPCHEGIPEEDFNCLFCYCPLYALGRKCGGACTYTERGSKSCADCTFPHWPQNYEKLLARYEEIMEVVKRMDADFSSKKCRLRNQGIDEGFQPSYNERDK